MTTTKRTIEELTTEAVDASRTYAATVKVGKVNGADAVKAFDQELRSAFQDAYRTVHPSNRASVMSAVTMAAIQDGVAPLVIADLNDAMTNLPDSVSRVNKPTLTDDQAATVRAGMQAFIATWTRDDLATFDAADFLAGADDDALTSYIERVMAAAIKAAEKVTSGGKGDVQSFGDDLNSLLADGIIGEGDTFSATYKGVTQTVTVGSTVEDGDTIVTLVDASGNVYTSLSNAYSGVFDGRIDNGWRAFKFQDGRKAADLRRK